MDESKLPTSQNEIATLALICIVAGLAGIARVLYGKDQLTVRMVLAALLTSVCAALIIYPVVIHTYGGDASGYISCAAAAMAGTFTDIILRGAREWITAKRPPTDVKINTK